MQATTVAHEPTPWGQTHYLDLHGSKGTLRGWTDWEKTYKLLGAKAEEKQFQEIEIPELIQDGQQLGDIQKMYKETFRKRGQMTGEFIEEWLQVKPAVLILRMELKLKGFWTLLFSVLKKAVK